jgi:hypothetical protein
MLLADRSPANPVISPVPFIPLPTELRGRIHPAALRDPLKRNAILREWPIFAAMCDTAAEVYDDSMPAEDFLAMHEQVLRLGALGVVFDPTFLALVNYFHWQLRDTEDDADLDRADDMLDLEDSDRDDTDFWVECCDASDDRGCGNARDMIDRLAELGCPEAMEFVCMRDGIGATTSDGVLDSKLAAARCAFFGRPVPEDPKTERSIGVTL